MKSSRIPIFRPFVAPEAAGLVERTLYSGWIGEGDRVRELEAAIARYIHNPLFLATNSCTSAISLALALSNIKPGDEVISTPLTCVATNLPILHRGAKVVWADIGLDGTIDPAHVSGLITEKTRLIVAVHFGGYPAAVDALAALVSNTDIPILEDAAHALGSSINGNPIGSHSRFVCFSFQAIKTLTTVDGGGLALLSEEDYMRARRLRWFGIDREAGRTFFDDIDDAGYRFSLNDVLASIGLANFSHIDRLLMRRRRIACLYETALSKMHGIIPCHQVSSTHFSSFWLYPVLVDERDNFVRRMAEHGVECSRVHKRNDTYTAFKDSLGDSLEGVKLWDEKMVCLPIGHWVTNEDVEYIIECIKAGW